MPPDPLWEWNLHKGMPSCYMGIHLHKGGPTHAHWRLPCQACPQLRSAAFPRCNTLKPTHQYLLLTQKGPSSKHMLILQQDLGLADVVMSLPERGGGAAASRTFPQHAAAATPHPIYSLSEYRSSLTRTESQDPPKIQRPKQQKTTRGTLYPCRPSEGLEGKFPTC